MSRSILFIAVFITLGLLAGAVVGAAAGPALAAIPYVTETPLAAGPSTQDAPHAFGSWGAVWEDDAAGDWDIVWLHATPTTLALGPSDQRHPVTTGSWVAYEDDRGGTSDIYACHPFVTSTASPTPAPSETPIATGPGDQLDPAIDGETLVLVYEDDSNGNWDVCTFDLYAGVGRRLSANVADQVDPAISGNRVVFADHRNGNWDVYLYNLGTHALRRLTTSRADQKAPQISGNVVVYQDHRNGNWDIYACMLTSGVERRLTTNKADQTVPQVNTASQHDIVVYQDSRHGDADIYLYDLSMKKESRLTDDPADQTSPSAAKNRVAWCDTRGASPDVYLGSFEFPSFDVNVPSSPPGYNSTVTLHGWLRTVHNVRIVKSGAGGTRSILTGDKGGFSITLHHVQRKCTVRVAYRGDATHLAAKPVTVSVKPHALLTRPVIANAPQGPGLPGPIGYYVCRGFLKPQHRAGSQAVTLRLFGWDWRNEHWVCTKTMTPKIRDYANYSMYSSDKLMLLPTQKYPKWKIQATHGDKDHAKTVSPFSAVIK